jgi:hypothetical protein
VTLSPGASRLFTGSQITLQDLFALNRQVIVLVYGLAFFISGFAILLLYEHSFP